MSTRGYLTLIDKKKEIKNAVYLSSDAYPSYYGLQILDALEHHAVSDYIEKLKSTYPEDYEMVDGIQRNWYIKDKANKDGYFNDYVYEIDTTSHELSVYHFGDKVLKIPFDQIALYRFIFENEDKLYLPLSLDEKTMMPKKDFYKELRGLIKNGAGIKELQKIINDNPKVLHVESGRYKDATNQGTAGFNKKVYDNYSHCLTFCVSKHEWDKQFHLHIQTPFYRVPIPTKPLMSAGAAEKTIGDFVRLLPEDLRATSSLFKDLSTYSRKIQDIFANDKEALESRTDEAQELKLKMMTRYNSVKKNHTILGDSTMSLANEINQVVYRNYRWASDRLAEKASLSDMLTEATKEPTAQKPSKKELEPSKPTRS